MLDVADNPGTAAGDIKKRIRKPWRTVKRQLDALTMLGVLVIDEKTETWIETASDGTSKTKKTTYEVHELNPEFDIPTLKEMGAIRPDEAEAEM